jgi:hypothetical protein
MNFVEVLQEKLSVPKNIQKVLIIINAYIITQIISISIINYKIGSMDFLFNGIELNNSTENKIIFEFSKYISSNKVSTFLHIACLLFE